MHVCACAIHATNHKHNQSSLRQKMKINFHNAMVVHEAWASRIRTLYQSQICPITACCRSMDHKRPVFTKNRNRKLDYFSLKFGVYIKNWTILGWEVHLRIDSLLSKRFNSVCIICGARSKSCLDQFTRFINTCYTHCYSDADSFFSLLLLLCTACFLLLVSRFSPFFRFFLLSVPRGHNLLGN